MESKDRIYTFKYNDVLKNKYDNPNSSDVKTYKLSKEELEEYLKSGKLPKRIKGE